MTTRPSADMRREVSVRAMDCCEYCLIHETLCASAHQIDHVIAEKHGGPTSLENLALSCMVCNLRKASDIASLDPITGEIVGLFHPRKQKWNDVFVIEGDQIIGITNVGRTTVHFMQFNSELRVKERRILIQANAFLFRSDPRKAK